MTYKTKLFDRLFARFKKKKESEDLLGIANRIGPVIDKLVIDLFVAYSSKLMVEPITYIVPAVWGANKDGPLDTTQKEIHRDILPAVDKIFEALELKDLTDAQEFAIGFLIRGYIISKVTYIVESFRNHTGDQVAYPDNKDEYMLNVKPLGTA